MRADILQHPSAKVIFDPRDPPQPAVYEPPTLEDWERLEVYQGLSNLCEKYGAQRVMNIVRVLAHINGEDIADERPAHLCLADGAALPLTKICPRCGRDNS